MAGASSGPLPGAIPDRLPESAAPLADFDPEREAKMLLRATRAGALATIDRNTGHPFASLVNVASDSGGAPVILVSRLSSHTANLEADARASLLLASSGKGDALAHPRLTVVGRFAPVDRKSDEGGRVARRFLACHPKSELYAGFGDFQFWRMAAVAAHLNGGFGRAANLPARAFLIPLASAEPLLRAEERLVADINAHEADLVQRIAARLRGDIGKAWRLTTLDPDGIDLASGDETLRVPFPKGVTSAEGARDAMRELAETLL